LAGILVVSLLLSGCESAKESEELYQRGKRLGQQGRYSEAIKAFKEAIELDPSNALAHNGLGFAYLLTGEEKKGEKELKEALRLDPRLTKAIRNLATLYHRQKRFKEAVSLWERLTEIKPKDAKAWNNLANACFEVHHIQKAIAASKRALALAPKDPVVINTYANMQKQLLKLDEAEKYYKQLRDMRPEDKEVATLAILGLAQVYFLKGNLAKAKVAALQARKEFPDDYRVSYQLGEVQESLGELDEAAKSYQEAIRLAPNNARLMCRVGDFYRKTKKSDEAASLYRRAIETDGKYTDAYIRLVSLWAHQKKNLDEAESLAKAALANAGPGYKQVLLDLLSIVKRLEGDYDQALKYSFEAMKEIRKGDSLAEATIRVHRARIYREKGDLASTKAELEAALALEPPETVLKEIDDVAEGLPPQWQPQATEKSTKPGAKEPDER